MGVDLVLDQELLGLAAADVGLGLVVGDHDLDRPAVDAAGLVDAVHRHLQADQRGLAAGCARAGQRLQRSDLVGLGLAEGRLPRRRHQHGRAERACRYAVSDHAAARDLAAVPKVASVVSHGEFLSGPLGQKPRSSPRAASASAWFVAATLPGSGNLIELIASAAAGERTPLMSPQGPRLAVPTIRRHSIKSGQSYTLAKACQQPVRRRRNGPDRELSSIAQAMGMREPGDGRISEEYASEVRPCLLQPRNANLPTCRRPAKTPAAPSATANGPGRPRGSRRAMCRATSPSCRPRSPPTSCGSASSIRSPARCSRRARPAIPRLPSLGERSRHPHRPLPLQGVPQRRTGRRADRHRPSTGATIW